MIHTARKFRTVFCGLALCGVAANASDTKTPDNARPASLAPPASVQPISRDLATERDVTQRLEDEARFSLSLRREPLAQMMALIENATALRFRCGTLPDAPISVNVQDAPLLATLEPLLQDMGFALRRDGLNIFLFSNRVTSGDNAPDVPTSWTQWQGVGAPPIGWANPRQRSAQSPTRISADSLVYSSPLSVQWNAPHSDKTGNAGWLPVALQIDGANHPGIAVSAASTHATPNTNTAENTSVWMRWPLDLREVPIGAQLSIETPSDVTLFVNGAPLLSGRRGKMQVNLDRVLKPGANCLALHWPRTTQNPNTPLLRYEWFVGGKPDVQAPAQAGARLENQNPQLSQPLYIQPDNSLRPADSGAAFADAPRQR